MAWATGWRVAVSERTQSGCSSSQANRAQRFSSYSPLITGLRRLPPRRAKA